MALIAMMGTVGCQKDITIEKASNVMEKFSGFENEQIIQRQYIVVFRRMHSLNAFMIGHIVFSYIDNQ